MKQKLIETLKLLFSDVRQAIIGAIAIALVGGTAGILYLSKTALSFSIEIANTPTPLWATIALVLLCCLYIYLKIEHHPLKKQTSDNTPVKTKLFEVGNFKWKTEIYNNNDFKVQCIPYCIEHTLKLVEFKAIYICPAVQLKCESQIKRENLPISHSAAKSFIERMLNKKLC